jgi:hypothetical protein
MNELESSNAESMLFELFPRHKEQPDTHQYWTTNIEINPQSRGIVISVPCTLSSVC